MPTSLGQFLSSLSWDYDQIFCKFINGLEKSDRRLYDKEIDVDTPYNIVRKYSDTRLGESKGRYITVCNFNLRAIRCIKKRHT